MEFLSIYTSYIKAFFKARMEYRFSFFTAVAGNFYSYFITYSTFWALTEHFQTIDGWTFEELVVLYGLNLFTYSVAGVLFWFTVYNLDKEITSGKLDGYLIRPMGVIKQLVCCRFGDTFLGQILVTLVYMIVALLKIGSTLKFYSIIYMLSAIIGGVFLQSGAMIILGSLSFWMLRSREFSWLIYYDIRSMINYPLSIFPQFIRTILTFILPWAIINYYPSLIILGKPKSNFELIIGILSPIIGIGFFLVSLVVFNRGLRRYSGSGS